MWKALGAVVVICLAGLGLGAWSLVWPQRDYVSSGACSMSDIDKTYAALHELDAFDQATRSRINDEFWRYRRHRLDLRSHLERNLNAAVDDHFGRRQTAAFVCNRVGSYFGHIPQPRTVPALAMALAPYTADFDDSWKAATCVALLPDPYTPYAPSSESVTKALSYCRNWRDR